MCGHRGVTRDLQISKRAEETSPKISFAWPRWNRFLSGWCLIALEKLRDVDGRLSEMDGARGGGRKSGEDGFDLHYEL
ncbi:hypothetical protein L484_011058 [Morus notabilis]|uniref:Uncharacterized protein n=1 Tax=Morus notabilis TaxID=981085 RepID=W9QUD7_9ROSA|nr:hypothetical protein L484_011058 [Morus notabilis]